MNLGRLRILLTEDSPDDFVIIRETLIDSQLDVDLIGTDSLAGALQHLRDSEFDCVLLDLSLRDADGPDVLAQVLEVSGTAAVIVLTGRDDNEMALQAIRDGAQDYLKKRVFEPDTFSRAIHYAVQRKRMSLRLAASQRRFALVAKATRDGIWDWDVEKDTLYAAARWYKMTGSRPQPFQYDLQHWLDQVHPEDQQALKEALQNTPSNSEEPIQHRYRMLHNDGKYRQMMSRWVGITESNKVVRLVGAQSDISPRPAAFPITESKIEQRMDWEADFYSGLKEGEFRIQYQPVLVLATREIVSLEALVRWQHPKKGLLLPEAFIPCTEKAGLIVALGTHVIKQACRDIGDFPDGIPHRVSINLTGHQLLDAGLLAILEAQCKQHRLEIEITEKELNTSPDATLRRLREIRELGIQVTLDDFGSSSANCLDTFPLDSVKLSRSLIERLGSHRPRIIVSNLIRLANELDLAVIAKGVETQEQHDLLTAMHCQSGQGFYYSAAVFPVDLAEVDDKAG